MNYYANFDKDTGQLIFKFPGIPAFKDFFTDAIKISESTFSMLVDDGTLQWFMIDGQLKKIDKPIDLLKLIERKIIYLKRDCDHVLNAGLRTSFGFVVDCNKADIINLRLAHDQAIFNGCDAIDALYDYDNVAHLKFPLNDLLTVIKECLNYNQTMFYRLQNCIELARKASSVEDLNWIVL